MNVDHIYQLQRDDAFAAQFSAQRYRTFVAMPFSNRGGYPEPRIKQMLLKEVHERANALIAASGKGRTFEPLHRVDGEAAGAMVITDQIVNDILAAHFFLGDLTGSNFGVVIEVGIALALKPNGRVLLFTQDDTAAMHFDLRVTNVNRYIEATLVELAATALVQAAQAFEEEANRYIRFVTSQLTPDAVFLLNIYGRLWKDHPRLRPSLHLGSAARYNPIFSGDIGRLAFNDGVRELSAHRMVWTDYNPMPERGVDEFGIHATELGWQVIEKRWHHDRAMRKPEGAPTGPN